MKYAVVMPSNSFGINYADGLGGFTSTMPHAHVFDDESVDTKYYIESCEHAGREGSALLWAERHAKEWARIKKKKIVVVPVG
jgi:hypothetical protein